VRVELSPGIPGGRWASLRPVTGRDEIALDPAAPGSGTGLAAGLLVDASGTRVGPATLGQLSMADHDRILAAVYAACFGDRIESAATCVVCGEAFALALSLKELLARQSSSLPENVTGPDADGWYRLDGGPRFRLPTVADVREASSRPPDDAMSMLQARCFQESPGDMEDRLQEAMERLAPVLDFDIDTRCPTCAAPQQVRFSIESFLLRALARERRFLNREVHRLADAYGWGLGEILSLSREDRRELVRLVNAERATRVRR